MKRSYFLAILLLASVMAMSCRYQKKCAAYDEVELTEESVDSIQ